MFFSPSFLFMYILHVLRWHFKNLSWRELSSDLISLMILLVYSVIISDIVLVVMSYASTLATIGMQCFFFLQLITIMIYTSYMIMIHE